MKLTLNNAHETLCQNMSVTQDEGPTLLIQTIDVRIDFSNGGPPRGTATGFLKDGLNNFVREIDADVILRCPTTGKRYKLVEADDSGKPIVRWDHSKGPISGVPMIGCAAYDPHATGDTGQ